MFDYLFQNLRFMRRKNSLTYYIWGGFTYTTLYYDWWNLINPKFDLMNNEFIIVWFEVAIFKILCVGWFKLNLA